MSHRLHSFHSFLLTIRCDKQLAWIGLCQGPFELVICSPRFKAVKASLQLTHFASLELTHPDH